MGRNRGASRDYRQVRSRSVDQAWADARAAGLEPCEVDAEPTDHEARVIEDLLGFDPLCRFANDGTELAILHVCTTNQGEPVRPGQSCFLEARTQLIEQGQAIANAGRAVRS